MKSYSDPIGRFIIIDIHTENKTLTLANIYAPNNDDPWIPGYFGKKPTDGYAKMLMALKTTPAALCLGIVDDMGYLFLHHVLLIARYYIHTCRLRNTLPKLQIYTKNPELDGNWKTNCKE